MNFVKAYARILENLGEGRVTLLYIGRTDQYTEQDRETARKIARTFGALVVGVPRGRS